MGKNAISPAARGLSRNQVAEILGVTDREVARMDGRQLHPTRAHDRVWRYDLAEVRTLMARSTLESTGLDGPEPDGETTAKAFKLFGQRKPLTAFSSR